MAACPPVATGGAFLSSLLHHIDCQGDGLGSAGYQALSDPSSPFSLVLTALLTIFVALFGLRLMLGGTLTVRRGVLAMVKIGIVLTLATSWPAVRIVIHDLVVRGPSQIGLAMDPASSADDPDLITRLQATDTAMVRLISLGTGKTDVVTAYGGPGSDPLQRQPVPDDTAFGAARVVFLSGVVAAFAVVHLAGGLLLALTPLIAALLLFDLSRGAFAGWARGLVFVFLGSIAMALVLNVQLNLLTPWLSKVLELRRARAITASAPIELLTICLAFALAMLGVLVLIVRVAFATDLQRLAMIARRHAATLRLPDAQASPTSPRAPSDEETPSRARLLAKSLVAAQRREEHWRAAPALASVSKVRTGAGAAAPDAFTIPPKSQPLRRTRPRASSGAVRRDLRS